MERRWQVRIDLTSMVVVAVACGGDEQDQTEGAPLFWVRLSLHYPSSYLRRCCRRHGQWCPHDIVVGTCNAMLRLFAGVEDLDYVLLKEQSSKSPYQSDLDIVHGQRASPKSNASLKKNICTLKQSIIIVEKASKRRSSGRCSQAYILPGLVASHPFLAWTGRGSSAVGSSVVGW